MGDGRVGYGAAPCAGVGVVGGLWRVLRGELETDQRRALWWWLWCSSMSLQYHGFMQLDTIGEFLNAGDLGRLVLCCRGLRGRRPTLQLRLRAVNRCSLSLGRAERLLTAECEYDYDSSGADSSEQVDQG